MTNPMQSDPVPAIRENDAVGSTAEIFADIRETLNVDVVNLIWRHLATMPGVLEWVWDSLRPLYQGPAISRAECVRNSLTLPQISPFSSEVLFVAGIDGAALASVGKILDSYQHTNALALVCFSAFLVRFDLTKLKVPPNARLENATVSFYVWDPSSHGKTRVYLYPMKTAWDESTVTWLVPQEGKSWQGGASFGLGADAGPAGPGVVVLPDQGTDTVDPPTEYQFDVTDLVRSWLDGTTPNLGVAIAPVIDLSVDEGTLSRFQVNASEHSHVNHTPKLTLQMRY